MRSIIFIVITLILTVHEAKAYEESGLGLTGPKTPQAQRKKKVVRKRKVPEPKVVETSSTRFGVGLEAGWEAPYGNAAVMHMIFKDFFDVQAGIGYNNSGLKIGAGAHILLAMSPAFSLRFGASLVRSQGRTSDVGLEAKFTPEGGTATEAIEARKDFTVSEAFLVAPAIGAQFKMGGNFALIGGANYNVVLSGNELKFDDGMRYNKNIELTNSEEFDKKFQKEAESLVTAGGIGFHAGVLLMF